MNGINYLTKFRAFQLDTPGSLFSYYKPGEYTLIEARLPSGGLEVLKQDLSFHNLNNISVLHITSWDVDHCCFNDLVQIINQLRPQLIEVPDYMPDSKEGQLCRSVIFNYDYFHQKFVYNVQPFSHDYFDSLPTAPPWHSMDVVIRPKINRELKNDMSLVKLFRSEGFSVLSLGDLDSKDIALELIQYAQIVNEVDILILPHHGANNGFTCPEFLDAVKPKLAICSSNYGNNYDHPTPEVCSMLSYRNNPLMTTKRGDVFIYYVAGAPGAVAVNMVANNELIDSRTGFVPKRMMQFNFG